MLGSACPCIWSSAPVMRGCKSCNMMFKHAALYAGHATCSSTWSVPYRLSALLVSWRADQSSPCAHYLLSAATFKPATLQVILNLATGATIVQVSCNVCRTCWQLSLLQHTHMLPAQWYLRHAVLHFFCVSCCWIARQCYLQQR